MKSVYDTIAGLDGDPKLLSKTSLVKAHGGDYNFFSKLDADESGPSISLPIAPNQSKGEVGKEMNGFETLFQHWR